MASSSIPLVLPRILDPSLSFKKYLNWLIALRERRDRVEHVTARPFELTIDPATVCQLSCPYCSTGAGTIQRERALMAPDAFRRVLANLGETSFLIWYFSTGEPLLNKHLEDMIAMTREQEIYSVISTNLSLPLSDARIDALLTSGLGCISISLDGATAETYSRYRVKGRFDLVMTNMRRLIQRKRQLGLEYPNIEWRFLVFRHNQHEIAHTRQLAADMGVDLLEFFPGYAPLDAPFGTVQRAEHFVLDPIVSGPALERALQRAPTSLLQALGMNPAEPTPAETEQVYNTKCDWLYFGTTVFPNGSISPCCVSNDEPDDFGHMNDTLSFEDIWNNDAYREARSLFVTQQWSGTQRVCARCPNRNAQDYQFRTTTQALLRNAPDWVLRVLMNEPDRFFHEADRRLCPDELGPLYHGIPWLPERFPEIESRLARFSNPGAEMIRNALTAPSSHHACDRDTESYRIHTTRTLPEPRIPSFPLTYEPGIHEREILHYFARHANGRPAPQPPRAAELPNHVLIIAATSGSGSELLTETLVAAGIGHRAREAFHHATLSSQCNRQDIRDMAAYLRYICPTPEDPPTLVVELTWDQLYFLTRVGIIPHYWRDVRFAWIVCDDLLEQALSRIAEKYVKYELRKDKLETLEIYLDQLTVADLSQELEGITFCHRQFSNYMALYDIAPAIVTREALTADPEHETRRILEQLDLLPAGWTWSFALDRSMVKRQYNAHIDATLMRLRQEIRAGLFGQPVD